MLPEHPTASDTARDALFGAAGKPCYYRTERGTPDDPEWVPARITKVRGDVSDLFQVEVRPDRGTDFGDDWYETSGPYGYTPSMLGGIVVRDLDRLRLPD